jgi:hypothetical protein
MRSLEADLTYTLGQRAAIGAASQGRAVSADTRRKIGAANRALWSEREITPEFRAAMAANGRKGKGRPKSAETRTRMSAAQKGIPKSPEARARMRSGMTGRTHTDEARQKIAAAGRGRPGPNSKLTPDQAREVRRRAREGERTSVLAGEFGISAPTVCDIKAGRSWTNLT